jgi:D-3-phosphoglycerate dehydrogenase
MAGEIKHGGVVLMAAPVHPVLAGGLENLGYTLRYPEKLSQETAAALLADCTGVITSTRLQLDKELLGSATGLRWIGRMGSGLEVIDLEAAAEQGIQVFSSPDGNCNAVAEHALGLLLALQKKICTSAAEVATGNWLRDENRGEELEGKTVGLIGFGHTGRAFAKLLQGFEVTILAYDPYNQAPDPVYVQRATLAEIQARADVLSFHVPMRPDTHYYFNAAFLEALERPVILLNTARGEVVDSAALETGIDNGKIKGAGIDVWEGEPLSTMPAKEKTRLLRMAQKNAVIITPHIAGYSHEALYKMSLSILNKLDK